MDFSFRFNQYEFSYKPLIILVFLALLAACGDESSTSTEPDTVAEAPTVVSTTPADMATNVSRTAPVIVTFTETIQLSSINSNRFTLQGPEGFIASSVSASDAVATLTPDKSLAILTPYTASLSNTISDLDNNTLGVDYSWSFTTADGLWGTETQIEGDDAADISSPHFVMDTQGNVLLVWRQQDGGFSNIWANCYMPDSGWGTAVLIETEDGDAREPHIAIDGQGNAIAVWSQDDGSTFNIWANRYTPGGGWGNAAMIETASDGDAGDPQIAMDAQGNALAVWRQHDGTRFNILANRYTPGSGWGTETFLENVNDGDASPPQLAMNELGTAVSVWDQFNGSINDIWANYYTPGSGWGTAELVASDNTGNALSPHVAMDHQGDALAVWTQANGLRNNIWANSYTQNDGWGTEEMIEIDDAGNAIAPQVAIDDQGNALAAWPQSDGSRFNIWTNRYVPGSGWGTTTPIVSNNENDAFGPRITFDAQGNALAVWFQSDGVSSNIWANRFIPASGWNTAKLLDNANVGDARAPQVAVDTQGNTLVVWYQDDGRGYNIWANWLE